MFGLFSADEEMVPVQQQIHTQTWRPVGKKMDTAEFGRESAEKKSVGNAYFCRFVRGIVWEKKENSKKQQYPVFGSEMDA